MSAFFFFAKLVTIVVVAYRISARSPFTLRGAAIYALTVGGVLACVAGFGLAVSEEARGRYGRVSSGVVVEKLSSSREDGTRYIGRQGGRDQAPTRPVVTAKGFEFYDVLGRILLTGSPNAWVIDYRFGCDAAPVCWGRDFVSEDLWSRLRAGDTVNVRRSDGETGTSRLDENPQWGTAFADLAIGGALLLAAGLVSGRFAFFRPRTWITAPAIVTAVEPVKYGDAIRWRVRFAYFDPAGAAQESADEVGVATWKPGDECFAVFQPNQPDLATMRAAP